MARSMRQVFQPFEGRGEALNCLLRWSPIWSADETISSFAIPRVSLQYQLRVFADFALSIRRPHRALRIVERKRTSQFALGLFTRARFGSRSAVALFAPSGCTLAFAGLSVGKKLPIGLQPSSLIQPKLGDILPKLGGNMESVSLSNALFSKVQQRVLALIFGHPERSFYASEIVRNVRSGTGAVERELSRLKSSGLVSVERIGNQKHYRANPDSPIFAELTSLVLKTVALAEPLKESLEPFSDRIDTAFIYGSVAKGTDTARSDIDLMVIGSDLDYAGLYRALQDAERRLARKVNPTFLSPADWKRRAAEKGSFVNKINAQPKIFVFGTAEDFQRWENRNSTIS